MTGALGQEAANPLVGIVAKMSTQGLGDAARAHHQDVDGSAGNAGAQTRFDVAVGKLSGNW